MRKSFILGISGGIAIMAWAAWMAAINDKPYMFICGITLVIMVCCNEALKISREELHDEEMESYLG